MARSHVAPLKWHYVPRFWTGPTSESQAKKQVMTNGRRGRYTRARCAREMVAVIGVSRAQTDVLKAVRQGGLRRPQVAFRPPTTDDWQQTIEHRRSDGDYGRAVRKKRTRTTCAVYLYYNIQRFTDFVNAYSPFSG